MPSTRHAYEHVASIYFPIAIAVFAIVVGSLVVMLFLGRRRKEASKRSEAVRLEGAYVLGLAGIIVFLLYTTFSAMAPIDRVVSNPAVRIKVTAAQWSWRFEYPNGATVMAISTWNPPVAPVPIGSEVEFEGTSQDVIHGFWVPEERFMRQLLPGSMTRFDLLFNRRGRYLGECSVYCGSRHDQMHFALDGMTGAEFSAWLKANAGKVIT